MKKLIILSGSSNSGKSETLKYLVTKLGGTLTTNYDDKYICNKGKLKILICTAGDYEETIEDNKNFFNQNIDYDIFISASRSYGSTLNNLKKWADDNRIYYIRVTKSWLEDKNNGFTLFNKNFADFIESLI